MATNEKGDELDNTLLNLDTSLSSRGGPIVPTLKAGVEHWKGSPLSLSLPLVTSPPSLHSTNEIGNGTVPPRPPRSPKRRLADISEDGIENDSKGTGDLKSVVADFVRSLEAVPPPDSPDLDSPDSAYSDITLRPTSTLHERIRSLPVIVEMLEVDRSRIASGGTFGGDLEMRRADRGSDETEASTRPIDTLPATPLLPTSEGHSPISPLALTSPPPGISHSADGTADSSTEMPSPVPSLHVTRPSTSSGRPGHGPEAFSAVVDTMNHGDSPSRRRARGESPGPVEVKEGKQTANKAMEGRAQIPRTGMMGPGTILAKVRSSQSLSKIKKELSKPSLRDPTNAASTKSNASSGTTFLRPAPLPPPSSTYPARFAPTNYARSGASSPAPSNLDGSFARATPDPRKSPARFNSVVAGERDEMVEIPRFKRKELNLALISKRGPWQRIGWVSLWVVWLVNGLAGLFFDVNLMYMLVQCSTHSTNGQGPSRSWAFATAAYAICWGISIFAVWLGWEVYFEFWRRWRSTRPAIEPIYTSLPASLHLSLMSYSHFKFLVHVRLSSLSTPFRYDIIPETAHALIQTLPGILPLLPRAGIGIVLLTTFSSASASRGKKDERFFASDGGLNAYAQGVVLAFVSVVGFRLLIFLISAIILWLSSARPARAFFARPAQQLGDPTTPKKRDAKSSMPPRDPSTTRSPQKTWYEAETSFGWDTWRSRMRARLQDAYELCMIRRSGVGIGSMVDGSFVVTAGGATPSPRFNNSVKLGSRSLKQGDGQGSVEELVETGESGKARAISEGAVDDWLGTPKTGSTLMALTQKRPDNPGPPSSQSQSSPSTDIANKTPTQRPQLVPMRTTSNLSVSGYPSSQASHSSHDIFYTPATGNTPVVEHTLPILGLGIQQPASQGIRNMLDPSRGTLPARPESGIMGDQELLSINRLSQMSAGSDESITDDSAALLSASSRRGSEATTTTGEESGRPSRSSSTASQQHGSRRSSVSRIVAAVGRSRAGSTASGIHVITRARSSSITLLRESAGAVQGVVRRARSGTVDGNSYGRIEGAEFPNTLPRRRSKLGLGPSVVSDRAVSG